MLLLVKCRGHLGGADYVRSSRGDTKFPFPSRRAPTDWNSSSKNQAAWNKGYPWKSSSDLSAVLLRTHLFILSLTYCCFYDFVKVERNFCFSFFNFIPPFFALQKCRLGMRKNVLCKTKASRSEIFSCFYVTRWIDISSRVASSLSSGRQTVALCITFFYCFFEFK